MADDSWWNKAKKSGLLGTAAKIDPTGDKQSSWYQGLQPKAGADEMTDTDRARVKALNSIKLK